MKKQIISSCIVAFVLICLYSNKWIGTKVKRVYSELAPGGFIVSYFADTDFKDFVTKRSERKVILAYGDGRPAFGVPDDHHAARWEGWLTIPEKDVYAFCLQSKGGAKVRVDGNVLLDKWDDYSWLPGKYIEKEFSPGTYKIIVEYTHLRGPGALRLRWAGGPIPKNTVMGAPHVRKRK